MKKDSRFVRGASSRRATSMTAHLTAVFVWAAVMLIGRLVIAQDRAQVRDESVPLPGPVESFHSSKAKLDLGKGETQVLAREMADALAGRIEQPIMKPTRSSFLAKWEAVSNASGYRLDVSTSPSFDSYVRGYQDVDLGNVTSQIVSGLERGKEYYYRVRAYDAAGRGGANSETIPAATANTNTGLVIVPSFDPTITSDPRSNAIQAMIISTIQTYQTLFSDPITVVIHFRFSAVDATGEPMATLVGASNTTIYGIDWNTYITALKADAKTANDMAAVATLPTSPLTANIVSKSAAGRAIGLNTPPSDLGLGGAYDGVITLNSSKPLQFTRPVSAGNFDARTFTEHEIDEVLGLGSHLGSAQPQFLFAQDLFSWASLNARNTTATGERHFSIDRGLHFIATFNQDPGGDFGDWESEPQCPQNHPLVQNAFNCDGQSPEISATSPEGVSLDVVGYDLVTDNGSDNVLEIFDAPAGRLGDNA